MNGVTGRMGTNQHLIRSVQAIREAGGVRHGDEVIWPDPILVGRNRAKLEALAKKTGVERVSTDLEECLANPDDSVYFDAQLTQLRAPAVKKAIEAGKHVYCEKPTGVSTAEALELVRLAEAKGVKHGVVQDKLWLPGLLRLQQLIDQGFFGRVLSVRGEFGYWVFTGYDGAPQRPSWNYRKQDGGGIMVDVLCHWRYVLDKLFGEVKSVSSLGAIHIPKRLDERNQPYDCTADDAAYSTFQIEDRDGNPVVAHFNSSWTVRVRRDDLLSIQVDGTHGSAVAGLRDCVIQRRDAAPDLESRYSPSLRLLRSVDDDARRSTLRERISGAMGDVSATRRLRLPVALRPHGRRARRATRRSGAEILGNPRVGGP